MAKLSEYDARWLRCTLEVIIQHYKELEEEIRGVRQEYEGILRNIVLKDAVKPEAGPK